MARARCDCPGHVTDLISCFLPCLAGPEARARCDCPGHITHIIACYFLPCLAGPEARARCDCPGHITHIIACCFLPCLAGPVARARWDCPGSPGCAGRTTAVRQSSPTASSLPRNCTSLDTGREPLITELHEFGHR